MATLGELNSGTPGGTAYNGTIGGNLNNSPNVSWVTDASGNPAGLVGPDGNSVSSNAVWLANHADEHAAMGILVSYPVLQTAIPFIRPSSGSFADNGALSGIAALPGTYTRCFMYFPAGAIHSTSIAGWYYAVMSSTTAATVYNNTYTSGQPTVPATPTAFVCTGPGAYTQTATSISSLVATIPAGLLGTSGRVDVRGRISYSNSANAKAIDAVFGGAMHFINSNVTNSTSGTEFLNTIQNRGSAGLQVANHTGFGGLGTTSSAATLGTVDTTVATTVDMKMSCTAAEYIMFERLLVEVTPA